MSDPVPFRTDEERRFARLRALNALDTASEAVFDRLARIAGAVCGAPIALVSLVDEGRQWFKANVGLPGSEQTPREFPFCAYAILDDDVMEVPDATSDPRFAANPAVLASSGIRFYAGAPIRMPEGERIGTVCVADRQPRHLTDAQRSALAELAALASHLLVEQEWRHAHPLASEFASIVQHSDDAVISKNFQGTITSWNVGATRIFGYSSAEIVGSSISRLFPPGREDEEERLMARIARGETIGGFEAIRRRKDSTEIDVAISLSPIRDAEGRVVGAVKIARDISQRKRDREELEQSEARYRALIEEQRDLVSLATPDGVLTYVNLAYAQHFGVNPASLVGTSLYDRIPQEERDTVAAHLRAVIEKEKQSEGENRMLSAGGQQRWMAWTNRKVVDSAGRTLLHSVGRDITDRKNAEAALAESERRYRDTAAQARRSEDRLRAITDNVPALISYIDVDQRFRFVNRAYEDWLGLAPVAIIGRTLQEIYGEAAYQGFRHHVETALQGSPIQYERELKTLAGRRDVQVTAIPDGDEQGAAVVGVYVLISDVTKLKRAEQAIRRSEEQLRAVADMLPMRVSYVDAEERYRFNNLAYERAFGTPRDGLYGKTVREVLGGDAYREAEPWIRRALAGERVTYTREAGNDDSYRCFEVTYIPDLGPDGTTVLGFQAVISDVTSAAIEARRLRQLAQMDIVTGVSNRIGFQQRLAQAVADSRAFGLPMTLMYLDVDRFKQINDTYGHATGDALLRAFASRLMRCLRVSDTVARLGGDEFAVLLERLPTKDQAAMIAEKILRSMSEPFLIEERRIHMTTSIGLVHYRGEETTPESLIKLADEGMYLAKTAGGNNWKAVAIA